MAKHESPEMLLDPVEAPPAFTGPRVPVALSEVAARIAGHLISTNAEQRLVRVRDAWCLVDISKLKPADIDAVGRKLGVLDPCEVIV